MCRTTQPNELNYITSKSWEHQARNTTRQKTAVKPKIIAFYNKKHIAEDQMNQDHGKHDIRAN